MTISQAIIRESNADYHARESISASRLKLLRESPRVYESQVVNGYSKGGESAPMKLGTAIHCNVLEPHEYRANYVCCPAECSDKRTKAYKAWAEMAGDRIAMTEAEELTIHTASSALRMHPIAGKIIRAAELTEGTVLYVDPDTGADCRFRFDGIAGPICFDIKTIKKCTKQEIRTTFTEYGYHVQAAHYLAGLKVLDPSTDWRFMFLYVETCEPWRVRVVDPAELDIGESVSWLDVGIVERSSLIRDLLEKTASGDWSEPGENEVCSVSVPKWYRGLD